MTEDEAFDLVEKYRAELLKTELKYVEKGEDRSRIPASTVVQLNFKVP